jgi:hypothetical protein
MNELEWDIRDVKGWTEQMKTMTDFVDLNRLLKRTFSPLRSNTWKSAASGHEGLKRCLTP